MFQLEIRINGNRSRRPAIRTGRGDAACRNAFIGVGVISGLINMLYLTGSIFMLEVYDRVLPSRSVPTLVGLSCSRSACSSSRASST